ncbi:MAG TPA: hypothetical protein VMT24_12020, partial [Aggregatilineaceae bacterium]|nr:hypothetical protein [Aggregatilineaceae bacterium]
IPWRTGVNMREFAYYGTPARQHTEVGLQRRQLEQLQAMQVKLVRFYASFNQFSTDQCVEKVLAALDLLQEFGMQAAVCLADSLGSEFTIAGDEAFHTGPLGHLAQPYWRERAYQQAYLPFLTRMVQACGQHPAVLLWELGNEYAIHPQPASFDDGQDFLEFARAASEAIKAAAPQALVSTGLVGSHHVAPAGTAEQYGRELYGLPGIDVISIHYYADDDEKLSVQREMTLAKALVKPFFIGEFGAPQDWPDRAAYYRTQLEESHKAEAFTAMPWAFDSSPFDVGVSDTKAFASIRPGFEEIKAAVQDFGRPIEPVVATLSPVTGVTSATKAFEVVDGPLFVRRAPSVAPTLKIEGVQLETGQRVEVDPLSRTIADRFIWWRHPAGWSAEASVDRQQVFMTAVPTAPGPTRASRTEPQARPDALFAPAQTKILRVIDGPVSWRDAPTLEPRALIKGKSWRTGQRVEVDSNSRTEAEGFEWWRHQAGWSAARSLERPEIYMVEEGQMVDADDLFLRLPLDVVQWLQYYGNTTFAFEHGQEKSYDDYSQGLHGGLDLGQDPGTPVVAGVREDVGAVCTYVGDQKKFPPNRVDITIGQYLIIFGHLSNPNFDLQDQPVGPDTVIGEVSQEEGHTHLEIRRGSKILNPLTFYPDAVRDALIGRFPPVGEFQPNGGQWEIPLDQPDITIGGKVIGPRASS